MRQLSLYIGGKAVDLNDDSLVVMNYTAEELSNPTIVKNSYSQQITLPATPNNNDIFGNIYRLDRSTVLSGAYIGTSFNPLVRTPFRILDNLGQVVESGYVKLDSISRKGADITYVISLYGGLGSFFYTLSYDDEGNKLTLADLPYIGGSDGELDFNITAKAVKDAWYVLGGRAPLNGYRLDRWGVINFVPTYNGIPEDFDASKAVAKIANSQGVGIAYGMEPQQTDSGAVYSTVDGWTLINLGKDHTGEDMKEYRSYLQRPAISIRKVFEAIQQLATSKGFTLNLDPTFFSTSNPYYDKAWMVLPSMRSVEFASDKKTGTVTGTSGVSLLYGEDTTNIYIDLESSEELGAGDITISGVPILDAFYNTSAGVQNLRFTKEDGVFNICCVMQLIATTEGGNEIGSNLVVFMDDRTSAQGATLVQNMIDDAGYVPVGSPTISECRGNFSGYPLRWDGAETKFTLSATSITSLRLRATWNVTPPSLYAKVSGVGTYVQPIRWGVEFSGTYNFASFTGARTGSLFTKQNLLRSEYTPIDYLLSYSKTFGLVFSYDKATDTITLLPRDTYYRSGMTIDFSERIDYSQEVAITPNLIESRFLEFKNESEGAYIEIEEARSGRAYGSQRVNTGDEFSKETKNAIDNNTFKGAAQVLRRSKYNTIIEEGGQYVPSVFVDADVKYTLYRNGEGKEFSVLTPTNQASIEYMNPELPTYDAEPRVQLHDGEDKPLDIADILVFYNGTDRYTPEPYQGFRVTDDNDYMSQLNEGTPCWLMDVAGTLDTSLPLPRFGRYVFNGAEITHSLDFGTPGQIDIPSVTLPESASVYSRGWKSYLADRYDLDTRVVRAKVDMRGLQVGERLLRNFYYFEGCYWVLNKIINYSLTSDAPVECEFVKVNNRDNYQNGQNY